MIEDKELRDLFRMECEEHLQCLDDGLLQLEQQSADQTLLDNMFRAAHSVKGAARMLGFNEIQNLAHVLEDALDTIRKNAVTVDKNLTADLYQKLSTIQKLVAEAVGEDWVEKILPQPVTESVSEPVTPEQPVKEVKTGAFQIGTLRVDPQRLDALLTHTGELAVTNVHIARRLLELDTVLENCESWTRSLKAGQNQNQVLQGMSQIQACLTQLRAGLYEDSSRLNFVSEQLGYGIRTIRLLPFSTLFNQFPRLVHELAQSLGKEVDLVLEGAEVVADKRILEELKDPIMHLLRNAVHHGLEDTAQRVQRGKSGRGTVLIRASQCSDHIQVQIQDDGRGLDVAKIKRTALKQGLLSEEQLALMNDAQIYALILSPGFTTTEFITEISGRGVGLDVVRANVEKLKGSIQIDSIPDLGATFRLQLPLTLATMRVQIVSVQGRSYALPLEAIQFSRRIKVSELFTMEGRQTLSLDGRPVAVAYLSQLLELQKSVRKQPEVLYGTFLKVDNELFALIVDELLDETEVMLKAQTKLLKRVRNVLATTILLSGEICPVLNPSDLLKSMRKQYLPASSEIVIAEDKRKKTLLLAEDSITTRTQEKRILESAGYEVVTAVDGLEAYHKFQHSQFDGVVSDIEMPNMTGFALTEAIRKDKKHADIPIIAKAQ